MEFNALDKYKKMLRRYKRLEVISTNTGNIISDTLLKDAVEDFFNQCYHFKDWLKKDKNINLSLDIEKYINQSQPLSFAADFCNTFKHSGLNNNVRSKKNLEKMNNHIKIDSTPKGFVCSSKLELTIDGRKYDAFNLATKCIEEWNKFLDINNIDYSL
jgi:predicted DNA-binding protein